MYFTFLALLTSAGLAAGEPNMTHTAKGDFDVQMTPASEWPLEDGNNVRRVTLEKTYRGELVATARGELLMAGAPVDGSAAYVGVEHVEGSLKGRTGTFVLAHKGVMQPGEQHLDITVVPGSGTGELAGLEGKVGIDIAENGDHFYTFEFTLGEAR